MDSANNSSESNDEETVDKCTICHSAKKMPEYARCGHSFCGACIRRHRSYVNCAWSKRCPLCRTRLIETEDEENSSDDGHEYFLQQLTNNNLNDQVQVQASINLSTSSSDDSVGNVVGYQALPINATNHANQSHNAPQECNAEVGMQISGASEVIVLTDSSEEDISVLEAWEETSNESSSDDSMDDEDVFISEDLSDPIIAGEFSARGEDSDDELDEVEEILITTNADDVDVEYYGNEIQIDIELNHTQQFEINIEHIVNSSESDDTDNMEMMDQSEDSSFDIEFASETVSLSSSTASTESNHTSNESHETSDENNSSSS